MYWLLHDNFKWKIKILAAVCDIQYSYITKTGSLQVFTDWSDFDSPCLLDKVTPMCLPLSVFEVACRRHVLFDFGPPSGWRTNRFMAAVFVFPFYFAWKPHRPQSLSDKPSMGRIPCQKHSVSLSSSVLDWIFWFAFLFRPLPVWIKPSPCLTSNTFPCLVHHWPGIQLCHLISISAGDNLENQNQSHLFERKKKV